MKDAEIEEIVNRRICKAVEAVAGQCIRDLNDAGHQFVADEDAVFEWVDRTSGRVLEINCVLGVSVSPGGRPVPEHDSEVEEYLAIAESGSDPVATALNELEGDVANGGFMQLRDNKGLDFFREALRHLEAIGATETAAVVADALRVLEESGPVFDAYEGLEREIDRLDERFYGLGESVASLYLEYIRK